MIIKDYMAMGRTIFCFACTESCCSESRNISINDVLWGREEIQIRFHHPKSNYQSNAVGFVVLFFTNWWSGFSGMEG